MVEAPFFPDDTFEPEKPYITPLVPPTVDPDFVPVNLPVSCYWLPVVAGALKILKYQSSWKLTTPDQYQLIMGRVNCLLAIVMDAINSSGCDSLFPPIACPFDFSVSDGGWSPVIPGAAAYVSGLGWQGVIVIVSPCFERFGIHLSFAANPITLTDVHVVGNRASAVGGANSAVFITTTTRPQFLWATLPGSVGPFDVDVSGGAVENVTDIEVDLGSLTGTCALENVISQVDLFGFAPSGTPCG